VRLVDTREARYFEGGTAELPASWGEERHRRLRGDVLRAFGRMERELCALVTRVVLVREVIEATGEATGYYAYIGFGGEQLQDVIFVNAARIHEDFYDPAGEWPAKAKAFGLNEEAFSSALVASLAAHEATHCYQGASRPPDDPVREYSVRQGSWTRRRLDRVDDALASHRLLPGFDASWAKVHAAHARTTAADLGWPLPLAIPYAGNGSYALPQANPRTGGSEYYKFPVFAGVPEDYGMLNASEDMATYVEKAALRDLLEEGSVMAEVGLCGALSTYSGAMGSGVPLEISLAAHKLNWLADVGLVSEESARACSGGARPGGPGPGSGSGWHVQQNAPGMPSMVSHYEQKAYAKIGTKVAPPGLPRSADGVYFQARAEGVATVEGDPQPAAFDLKVKLAEVGARLDEVGFPRGVVVFDNDPGQALTFELLDPDAPSAQRFYSSKGAAYFHRMSSDLIWIRVVVTEGAYTDVPFFTNVNPDDLLKRTFDPPLALTFILERQTAQAGP